VFAPAPAAARVERTFAGAYGRGGPPRLAAEVECAGPAVSAAVGDLRVAWTGPHASVSPGELPACLLDGEIFNLESIASRAGLPGDDPPETTLAAAFGRLGEGLLPLLRGEFALLLWDARRGTGLLARDQLGAGGLYIHVEDGRLLFASELASLLAALPRVPAPEGEALVRWLAEGTLPPDGTLYQGVVHLPPACLLRLRDGTWEPARFWSPTFAPPGRLDPDEAAEEVHRAVTQSVERRLRGRRRAGVLLSGGLDSGAVLGVASDVAATTQSSVHAYSAVFPSHPALDESELIGVQAALHGTPVRQMAVTEGSPLEAGLRYLDRWRVPLPVPGHFLWEPLLDVAAAEGAECMLDGEVGDELFGTSALLLADRLRRGRVVGAARLARSFPGAGASPSRRLVLSLLGEYGLVPCLPAGMARVATGRRPAPFWLSRAEARRFADAVDPHPWRSLQGPRWWAQLADSVLRGPERMGFFDYFRRRGRAARLPAHHPFLDLDLIERVLSLPPEYGFDRNLNRPLLRRAMRGIVAEPVRLRPGKSHFNSVMLERLGVGDRGPITRLLGGRDVEVVAFADPWGVRSLLEGGPRAHPRGEGRWVLDVWRLALAECWLRSQADTDFAPDLLQREYGRERSSPRSYVSPPRPSPNPA
jgi:asparagine synthase (glutamine-hydrolysing)